MSREVQLGVVPEEITRAAIDLWDWQHGGTSFNCHIYTLMQKADPDNLIKLVRSWPELALVWTLWRDSFPQEVFFERYIPKEVRNADGH